MVIEVHNLPLPFRADNKGKTYLFTPTCDVPDELGKHLLELNKDNFSLVPDVAPAPVAPVAPPDHEFPVRPVAPEVSESYQEKKYGRGK